ncbi:hypothetical protein CP978_25410 [Streptomyces nodosus]|uniref:Uncharacterized protein n=1 Tax=Streptomyces nodosus TaxID=40318 RepID=A0A5P2W676_9ACTN|nr:hypothetical protein CP978_25410 [Streptomyces nodosus]
MVLSANLRILPMSDRRGAYGTRGLPSIESWLVDRIRGRAAVSNWRRRHTDFPDPVGGMDASPKASDWDSQRYRLPGSRRRSRPGRPGTPVSSSGTDRPSAGSSDRCAVRTRNPSAPWVPAHHS